MRTVKDCNILIRDALLLQLRDFCGDPFRLLLRGFRMVKKHRTAIRQSREEFLF